MISREAATSGQLSLMHRGISDVKDVSNNLRILEAEQLALTVDGGRNKGESGGFETKLQASCQAQRVDRAWPDNGPNVNLSTYVFLRILTLFSYFFSIFLISSSLVEKIFVNLGLCVSINRCEFRKLQAQELM
jgi:hypothetical protein